MSATITYKIINVRSDLSESSIVLDVTVEMTAQETGKCAFKQSFNTGLPPITKDDANFTDISSLSGDALNTKLLNFAKNNWWHPENAVPSLSAMETYAKNEAANQATLEGP